MNVEEWPIDKLIPYARNPRQNENAIAAVAASLKEFGFQQPIVVDKENVVIVSHTRLLAARKLELKTVPVHMAKDLTEEQIKAYRIIDNKSGEKAQWDFELLQLELNELDLDSDVFKQSFDQSELDVILQAEWKPGATGTEDPHQSDRHGDNVRPVFLTAEEREVIERAVDKSRVEAEDPSLSEGMCVAKICELFLSGVQ